MDLTIHKVQIHPGVLEAIQKHSQRESQKGGYEAVGYVACKYGKSRGVATIALNNHSPDPQHGFFVEPWEQFRAERKLEQDGYAVFGIYHSHVNSEALPSETDHQFAWEDGYVFIYSVVFDELKAYRKEDGSLVPVELIVGKGPLS